MRIVFFVALLCTLPSHLYAEGAVVSGFIGDRTHYSYSYNKATRTDAVQSALDHCHSHARNCTLVHTYRNSCVYFIRNDTLNRILFIETYMKPLIAECRRRNHSCVLQHTICDTIVEDIKRQHEYDAALARDRELQIARHNELIAKQQAAKAEEELRKLWNADWTTPLLSTASDYRLSIVLAFLAVSGLIVFLLRARFATIFQPKQSPKVEPTLSTEPPVSHASPDSLIQATIVHKQERQHFFVYLTLKFSKHAQLLIAARQLQDHLILSGFPNPPPSNIGTNAAFRFYWLLRIAAPFMFLGSCIYGMSGALQQSATGKLNNSESIAFLLVLLSIILFAVSFIAPRRHEQNISEQEYTVKRFYREPTVRFYASNPVVAKGLDDEIRERLLVLRQFLEESKEMPAEDRFEL